MTGCSSMTKLLIFATFVVSFCSFTCGLQVTYDGRSFKFNGDRKIILSGSIHYPRSTPEMWPALMKKSKNGGLNAIETYVFWNAHEPLRRQYDFSGNLDLIRFIKTIQDEGMYSILRIGPYVCAEWNYGGLPVWLHNMPNVRLRTNNQVFMNEMQNFTTMIVEMLKKDNLFASQGGPIIIAQIENEYGNIMGSYGDGGKEYIKWCANLAESYNVGVPWIMCQQSDAPQPMINTCNGWYCDSFTPNNPNSPKSWTEDWTGWFKNWGGRDPHRTAEDLAFAVARFFQYGGSLHNYYMYHGGTNFGRIAGGPYITTTYDYDAPLDEYGNLNQPKWGHLKDLHLLLLSMERVLTQGEVKSTDYGTMMSYIVLMENQAAFLEMQMKRKTLPLRFEGNNYTVPAWSVSILPDCFHEVYNTAKVNAQTSVMVKTPNKAEVDPYNLRWEWKSEHFEHIDKDNRIIKGSFVANQLLDQKVVGNDTSDYVWYMTSINVEKDDPIWTKVITLKVHTCGHIVHAFLNGKHIGTQTAKYSNYVFDFERQVTLNSGENQLSLLSVTIGLANYGADYDQVPVGIVGPVQLISVPNSLTKDISGNKWIYKVGLHGFEKGLYNDLANGNIKWKTDNLPTNKFFVWYKTTFKAPLGKDPVVVDLLGLGKGEAWVNGHSIGRYWPAYNAGDDGCSYSCDYRGSYRDSKCLTNCGQPSQRWYHIPREYIKPDENTLILFEELGGNPANVKIVTVTIGKACAHAYEGNTLNLFCQGEKTISEIKFASFGDPKGSCGAFQKGTCESANTLLAITKACVGRQSCSIEVSENTFGPSGCRFDTRRLAVEAIC